MDPTDANEKWAPPSSLPDFAAAPRVRFTPPPPAWEPSYAPLGMRAKALAVDLLLALVVVIPLALLSDGFNSSNGLLRIRFSAPPILLAMVLWMAYMTLMEGKYGASVGKRATGLIVVTEDGLPIELEAALIRNALRFLDAFPYVVPYLLGFIVANRSPKRQRFGDRVAETIVVVHVVAEQPGGPAPYQLPVP
ncbi:MAG TPA: RDD family protein [Actinomycetota bacterium]|nr:RDD family protein [Actinomycetota bacterium]